MKRAILVFWVIAILNLVTEQRFYAQEKSIVEFQSIVLDIRTVDDAPRGEFRNRVSATFDEKLIEVFTWYDHECDLTCRDGQEAQHLQIMSNGRKWAEGAIDRLYVSPDGCHILLIEEYGNVALISRHGKRIQGRTLCLPRLVMRNGREVPIHDSIITELAVTSVAWHSQSRVPILMYEDGLLLEVDPDRGAVKGVLRPSLYEWRSAPEDASVAIPMRIKRMFINDRIDFAYGPSDIPAAQIVIFDESKYAIQNSGQLSVYSGGALVPIVAESCEWAFALDKSTLVTIHVNEGVYTGKTVHLDRSEVVVDEIIRNRALAAHGLIPTAVHRCNRHVVVFFSGGLVGLRKVAAWRWTAGENPGKEGEVIRIHDLGRVDNFKFECTQEPTRFTVDLFESESWPCESSRKTHFEY